MGCGPCDYAGNMLEKSKESQELSLAGIGFAILDYRGFNQMAPLPNVGATIYNKDGLPIADKGVIDDYSAEGLLKFFQEKAPSLDYAERLRSNPDDAEAYVLRAHAKFRYFNDTSGAFEDSSKAIRLYEKMPKSPERDSTLAKAYSSRSSFNSWNGNNKGALSDITEAIKLSPNDAGLHYDRSTVLLFRFKRAKAALADMDKAIELNPHNEYYYQFRAEIRGKLNDDKGRMEDMKMSEKIRKEN
ncbi:MAG: hypothetical protein NTX79_01395 [Candidatus Micrarchaeota archaeon]|nr:hypothetical protein [Candidatus Micrarchaeota archaeon]